MDKYFSVMIKYQQKKGFARNYSFEAYFCSHIGSVSCHRLFDIVDIVQGIFDYL